MCQTAFNLPWQYGYALWWEKFASPWGSSENKESGTCLREQISITMCKMVLVLLLLVLDFPCVKLMMNCPFSMLKENFVFNFYKPGDFLINGIVSTSARNYAPYIFIQTPFHRYSRYLTLVFNFVLSTDFFFFFSRERFPCPGSLLLSIMSLFSSLFVLRKRLSLLYSHHACFKS